MSDHLFVSKAHLAEIEEEVFREFLQPCFANLAASGLAYAVADSSVIRAKFRKFRNLGDIDLLFDISDAQAVLDFAARQVRHQRIDAVPGRFIRLLYFPIKNDPVYRNIPFIIDFHIGAIFQSGKPFYTVPKSVLQKARPHVLEAIDDRSAITVRCLPLAHLVKFKLARMVGHDLIDLIAVACSDEAAHTYIPPKSIKKLSQAFSEDRLAVILQEYSWYYFEKPDLAALARFLHNCGLPNTVGKFDANSFHDEAKLTQLVADLEHSLSAQNYAEAKRHALELEAYVKPYNAIFHGFVGLARRIIELGDGFYANQAQLRSIRAEAARLTERLQQHDDRIPVPLRELDEFCRILEQTNDCDFQAVRDNLLHCVKRIQTEFAPLTVIAMAACLLCLLRQNHVADPALRADKIALIGQVLATLNRPNVYMHNAVNDLVTQLKSCLPKIEQSLDVVSNRKELPDCVKLINAICTRHSSLFSIRSLITNLLDG